METTTRGNMLNTDISDDVIIARITPLQLLCETECSLFYSTDVLLNCCLRLPLIEFDTYVQILVFPT
jgi:hypothetical protein